MVNNSDNNDDDTDDDRMNYLKERGVEISTPEERAEARKANSLAIAPIFKQLCKINDDNNNNTDDEDGRGVKFVFVPHDGTKPIQTVNLPSGMCGTTNHHSDSTRVGDLIPTFVKPYFADKRSIDAALLESQTTKHFAAGNINIQGEGGGNNDNDQSSFDTSKISASAMNAVAAEGSVETFPLVHPADTNDYTGVYIYLDEVGMLKKLPMNKRAGAIGGYCGYNPVPIFYGDIFIGRTRTRPIMHNVDFIAGIDTDGSSAEWMQRAVAENLAWHQTMNHVSGRSGATQPSHAGTDGAVAKEINFTWTQDEEEIELTVPITITAEEATTKSAVINKNKINVKYRPRVVTVSYNGNEVIRVSLYESVDVDGCTWTLNKNELIITCEKADPEKIWPRISS